MKKTNLFVIGAVTLATFAAPMAASAQSWRHGDRDRDGRYERWERREDRRDDRRWDRRERERYNDYRRHQRHDAREYRRWARGQAIPYNYRNSWYIRDYNRYGYRTPPRGYGYYRTDTGDVVLAALATGVIVSLLSN